MDGGSFVPNGGRANKKTRQSIAIKNLRNTLSGGVVSFQSSGSDGIDDLVVKVLKSIDDEAEKDAQNDIPLARVTIDPRIPVDQIADQELLQQRELRASYFWTFFLAGPIIFTHGVATRMQFMYGGLYGRDGLNLNNSMAILAVGCTALGRATAPPLLRRYFQNPYFFMFLNATTLIGCSMMFLIPYVGGRENFDKYGIGIFEGEETASAITIFFFYISMYIQGLAEVLSGWDMLMKFEMRKWTPDQQQLAFRVSFVSIALGSATAFAGSSWLFHFFGLYGCAYLGVAMGSFNVVFPAIYLSRRWKIFAYWRKGGDKKRSVASRKSQPLMRMIQLDDLEDDSEVYSTKKLKFVPESERNIRASNRASIRTSIDDDGDSIALKSVKKVDRSVTKRVSEYVEPKNYFEFQKQLQHQTTERLMANFEVMKTKTKGFLQEQVKNLENADILAAFDPTLLLTHSRHIHWPKGFKKQIIVMRWFCIIALALGSAMISSQFAIYVLYLYDVWKVPVVFAGTSMAVGEISGMLTLLISIALNKGKAKESEAQESEAKEPEAKGSEDPEGAEEESDITATLRISTVEEKEKLSKMHSLRISPVEEKEELSKMLSWKTIFRKPFLLFEVPAMFVVCCSLAVIPLGLLGFYKSGESDSGNEEPDLSDIPWSTGLIVALSSGIAIGIVNCVMHATTIEMAALLLPEDLFESAVAWGYSFRRITNLLVCLMATGLYGVSPYLVYQVIATVYLLFVPPSIYVLGRYMKCMPWQKREVVFEKFHSMDDINYDESSPNLNSSVMSAQRWMQDINEEEEESENLRQDVEEKSDDSDADSNNTSPSSKEYS